jgi:hypothetical protein
MFSKSLQQHSQMQPHLRPHQQPLPLDSNRRNNSLLLPHRIKVNSNSRLSSRINNSKTSNNPLSKNSRKQILSKQNLPIKSKHLWKVSVSSGTRTIYSGLLHTTFLTH